MLSPFTDRLLADAVRLHCAPPDRATVAGLTRDAATRNPRTATPSPSPPTITPSTDPSDASRPVFWVWLLRVWHHWRSAVVIVRPDTVIAWHRRGFRLYWTWKSRRGFVRPTVPADVR